MSNTQEVLFTVAGFEVKTNTVYLVRDKKDGDAPSGFKNAGVSKVPHVGVNESFHCPSKHIVGTEIYIWDAGFHEESPCYSSMNEKEVKIIVKTLVEKVLKPYRAMVGVKNAFDDSNTEWLETTSFKVESGRRFNTENAIDRMELYMALRAHQLAPAGSEGDSKYSQCYYTVVDTSKVLKDKDEKNMAIFDAIGLFRTMQTSDRKRLVAILAWLNIKISDNTDDVTMVTLFQEYLQDSFQKAKTFTDLVDETEQTVGLDKVNLYKKLIAAWLKDPKLTKSPAGIFFYDQEEIGPDLKNAAENIARNSALSVIKKEILLLNDNK